MGSITGEGRVKMRLFIWELPSACLWGQTAPRVSSPPLPGPRPLLGNSVPPGVARWCRATLPGFQRCLGHCQRNKPKLSLDPHGPAVLATPADNQTGEWHPRPELPSRVQTELLIHRFRSPTSTFCLKPVSFGAGRESWDYSVGCRAWQGPRSALSACPKADLHWLWRCQKPAPCTLHQGSTSPVLRQVQAAPVLNPHFQPSSGSLGKHFMSPLCCCPLGPSMQGSGF